MRRNMNFTNKFEKYQTTEGKNKEQVDYANSKIKTLLKKMVQGIIKVC